MNFIQHELLLMQEEAVCPGTKQCCIQKTPNSLQN